MDRLSRILASAVAVATLCCCAGCSQEPTSPRDYGRLSLQIVAGDGQSGAVATELAQPLVVKAMYANGKAAAFVTVDFHVTDGGGSMFAGAATTDVHGIAADYWTLGTSTAAAQRVEVRAVLSSGQKQVFGVFNATPLPGPPSQIAANGGDNQSAPVNTAVAVAPSVIVHDQFNNPVNNATVAFATATGGGSVSGPSQTTNAAGVASVGGWTLGPVPGANTLTATVTGSGVSGNPVTFAATGVAAQSGILDQQQLLYNGGTSARTLPGYTVWQSFTAGITGTLTQIDMGFFVEMTGSGQLQILAGDGTSGQVLQTLTVPVHAVATGITFNSWTVSVPVQAGSVYTFNFTPNAATLPDPYGVAIGTGNPYPGGVMGLNDPSGSYRTDFDLVFRTYVTL